MKFRSVFDIIGPIMIGPSSSHTAGAARIGLFARYFFGNEPQNIEITLYGSFKDTYKGHGTDIALIGGLLGYDTHDKRIRTSLEDAKKNCITYKFIESEIEHIHPNTAKIVVEGNGDFVEVIGKSIGGGKMVIFEVQGFEVEVSADFPTLFIFFDYNDDNIDKLTKLLKENSINKNHKFSSSVIEGKGLLIAEQSIFDNDYIKKLRKINFIRNIRFCQNI